MNNLIVLTTCGNINLLFNTLKTLKQETNDILIIDDGSKVNYKKYKLNVIQKKKGKGLTDSWNIAYKYFKDNNYDRCVLSNDDVMFPNKVPDDMWKGLDEYKLLGPLSDPVGSGRFAGQFQDITRYIQGVKDFRDVENINKILQNKHPQRRFLELYKDIKGQDLFINGFCFSFDKKIIDYEFSKDTLFNPAKINTGNEKELQMHRLLDGKAVSIKSYVFHFKGQTFIKNNRESIINK